ncbi:hypothetical protein OEA41_005848 [Lepraria neglecta]|uniref:EGF-like domain-containing protein n=1 Tax=Lepraria neglecta TaxID=209136 RepID=A0AAE0DK32_9LECA|nr:hypothetical protein OEA41_005848 [Lepraria neglecta]
MESDTREPVGAETGVARPANGKKSPSGSVKRARERATAGLPPERPQMPDFPIPLNVKSPKRSPPERNQYPQFQPQASGQASIPPSSLPSGSSRPQQGSAGLPTRSTPTAQDQNVGRGPAPQRPPRPNFVSPMLQTSGLRDNQPAPLQLRRPQNQEQSPQNYWEESGLESGGWSRPLTTSSYSSTGSIPDFPSTPSIPVPLVPTFQPPPRRNLGPPPSARKAGSAYYSQTSFVPPIPEEISDSHSSYASSHVMPVSWEDGPLEYYMGPGIEEEEEDSTVGGDSGRASSAGDHDDGSNLVRKASKGTPRTLDTVESGDESDVGERRMRELDWQNRQDERWRPGFAGGAGQDPIGRHNFRNNGRLHLQPYSGYESDATFLDSPTGHSPIPQLPGTNPYFGAPSPSWSPIDPRVNQILGHLEKGGALSSTSGTASPEPSLTEKGFKRPPRLNLEGSREGPGRGSATSLPELIRRATRLASNLDRGKTASRIGMLDLLNAKEREARESKERDGKAGSISDILAAFPSPSPTTPNYHKPSNRPGSPSPHGKSGLSRTQTVTYGSQGSNQYRERRCCGLPVWAFILLLIILLLLIAAAIIIPITLIVLPHHAKDNAPDLASCQTSSPCGHGGTSIVSNSLCRCICANGFTGSTCNSPADSGCTTTDIPVTGSATIYHNATLGDSLPRIITGAKPNFSIPITSYTILSLFSATNLTCSSENALVTFNGQSQRRDEPFPLLLEDVILLPTKVHTHPSHTLHARGGAAQTSNSIIFAAPTGDMSNSAPAPTTSATSPSGGNIKPITQPVLDFARTAVLFIFQETSSLETTTIALNRLQATLAGGKSFDASQTSAGGNITVDLWAMRVDFGNGTHYGAPAPG